MSVKPRLLSSYPEVAALWHPTMNGNLCLSDVEARSKEKVWWKCPVADDHEWQGSPMNRIGRWQDIQRRGRVSNCCPFCVTRNRRVSKATSLATCFPQIAKTWHSTNNGELTPNDVSYASSKMIWWVCDVCSHEWKYRVCGRTGGRGCPVCRDRRSPATKRYGSQVSTKIRSYATHAKLRGLSWELSDDIAAELLLGACHYCGLSCLTNEQPIGIDRIDNTHGYTIDNVVSCCAVCNHAKCEMSVTDFFIWLDRLARHQGYTK